VLQLEKRIAEEFRQEMVKVQGWMNDFKDALEIEKQFTGEDVGTDRGVHWRLDRVEARCLVS